jgi:uncharacterized protein DUF1501
VANVGRLRRPPASIADARSMFNAMTPVDRSLTYLPGGFAAPGWAGDGDSVTAFPEGRGMSLLTPGTRRGRSHAAESGADLVTRIISSGRDPGSSFPATGIGQQLKQVARILSSGINGDAGSQVFLVQLGGFATHSNQIERHGALLRQLSEAMGAFYRATVDMGIANRVVTYTDTEFSRTLAPNAKGGTERGWGGHQLVMGGSVLGGEVFGEFPALDLGSAADVTGTGVWQPAITKRQYSQAFANWMGLPGPGGEGPQLNFLA